MLEEAKQHCDWLIVALQTDPTVDRPEKNKPIQSIVERYVQVEACKWVDQIVPYTTEKDLEDIFLSFNLDVRVIGSDYLDKQFTAKNICIDRNIKIIYNKRDHNWSSTNLRGRISRNN
jgi:glycerol-3-phosphate cytidylyltransferase